MVVIRTIIDVPGAHSWRKLLVSAKFKTAIAPPPHKIETRSLFCKEIMSSLSYKTNLKSLSHKGVELWPSEIWCWQVTYANCVWRWSSRNSGFGHISLRPKLVPTARRLNTRNPPPQVVCKKRSITFDLPVQLGFFVYSYAKLKMLMFYFDVLDKFIDRSNFCLLEMDTGNFSNYPMCTTHT